MATNQVAWHTLAEQVEALRAEGASVMFLAVDGVLLGLLAVSDPIKPSTLDALQALRTTGVDVIMASGDGITTARAVGAKLGITEVYGEAKPQDKLLLVDNASETPVAPTVGVPVTPGGKLIDE